jgi:hypothetical protein
MKKKKTGKKTEKKQKTSGKTKTKNKENSQTNGNMTQGIARRTRLFVFLFVFSPLCLARVTYTAMAITASAARDAHRTTTSVRVR